MKRTISTIVGLAIVALTAAGCATTEVNEFRAAPGQEILQGKGGAVKVVNGVEIWLDGGSPPRAFRIIAEATTDYRTGALDGAWQKNNALEQLADEAKKRGADAVVIWDANSRIGGFVTIPGSSTTTTTGTYSRYGNTGYLNAQSRTTTSPDVTAPIGAHTLRAFLVKYEG